MSLTLPPAQAMDPAPVEGTIRRPAWTTDPPEGQAAATARVETPEHLAVLHRRTLQLV